MTSVEQMYMKCVMAMTPDEKLARTAIARSIVVEHGEMPERDLKQRVALRLYGSEPVAALIEEEIRSLKRNPYQGFCFAISRFRVTIDPPNHRHFFGPFSDNPGRLRFLLEPSRPIF